MAFERAVDLAEFEKRGRSAVFKSGKRQILIADVGGAIYALDNRCPHEGYPLSKGTTDDGACTLTCNWHNWKFQLSDGACLIGDDDVRVYDTKVEDGAIWVDVSPPPREQARAAILRGLEKGFRRRTFGQLARELARLHFSGFDVLDAIRAGVLWSHDRLEFGTTHAYAALADWLALYDENRDRLEDALIPLAEALDHMSFDALRHPVYPFPEVPAPFDEAGFLDAVEREDHRAACAQVLGAIADGGSFRDLQPVFARAALSHYADFGHSLIYTYKGAQVSAMLADRDVDRALALNLARSICYATREDLIPEFAAYAPALERIGASAGDAVDVDLSRASVRQALDWTVHALGAREPAAIYDELLQANADAMLHYDASFGTHVDRPVSQNTTWLSFTHALTFANAVRVLCEQLPDLWPQGLLQMACFLGRNVPFVDRSQDVAAWAVEDEASFIRTTKHELLDHGLGLPIFSAHLLKTAVAIFEELPTAAPGTRTTLLASLNRFLHSPIKAKHARRLVHQGIELVARDFD